MTGLGSSHDQEIGSCWCGGERIQWISVAAAGSVETWDGTGRDKCHKSQGFAAIWIHRGRAQWKGSSYPSWKQREEGLWGEEGLEMWQKSAGITEGVISFGKKKKKEAAGTAEPLALQKKKNFWGGTVRDECKGFFEGFCRGLRESRADSLSSSSPWIPSSPGILTGSQGVTRSSFQGNWDG